MKERLGKIFRDDGRALIVPIDHTISGGIIPGWENPADTLAQVIEGGADAVMTTYGILKQFRGLMAGKVAGLGAMGLTQVLVWVASAMGFSSGAVAFLAVAGAASIPARVLILGVVYYLLGYTLYAILMAGIGALGTTMRESQQLAGIFSFFAAVPYMVGGFLFANPNILLARVLSFFPLTAPTMMLMRLPLAEVAWVDVAGSILILLISVPAALWVGAKLFRVGMLIYGKRPTVKEIWLILRGGG